jgi:hypothetical protein
MSSEQVPLGQKFLGAKVCGVKGFRTIVFRAKFFITKVLIPNLIEECFSSAMTFSRTTLSITTFSRLPHINCGINSKQTVLMNSVERHSVPCRSAECDGAILRANVYRRVVFATKVAAPLLHFAAR